MRKVLVINVGKRNYAIFLIKTFISMYWDSCKQKERSTFQRF